MVQSVAATVTVLLVGTTALVFLWVLVRASAPGDAERVSQAAARARSITFWALVAVTVIACGATLGRLPYHAPPDAREPLAVNVTGHQWSWELSRDTVPAGVPVAFHVTSADVNHGFALYDAGLRVVAQTQAMPGYVNVLYHTFEAPGTYRVLCLEYCGLAHHAMTATLTVTDADRR